MSISQDLINGISHELVHRGLSASIFSGLLAPGEETAAAIEKVVVEAAEFLREELEKAGVITEKAKER